jgi:hypothetical protein
MIRGLARFTRGLLRLPLALQLWLLVLGVLNMVVPLMFLGRAEARVTLVAIVVAMSLMVLLTQTVGFTRLLGAGHFVWFALLPFLWSRLDHVPAGDLYGYWLRAVIAANAISLALDVIDVIRYARGDRAELMSGL